MTNELRTTQQAAIELGMTYAGLNAWLYRHPEFRPTQSFGNSSVWTSEEIDAVRKERNAPRSEGSS